MNRFSDQNLQSLATDTELPLSVNSADHGSTSAAGDAAAEGSSSATEGTYRKTKSAKRSWAKRLVIDKLSHLVGGEILIDEVPDHPGQPNGQSSSVVRRLGVDGDVKHVSQSNPVQDNALSVRLKIADAAFYRRTLLGGTIGAAESYIDGDWGTDNLTDLIRILIRNMDDVSKMERTWSRARKWLHRMRHLRRKNSIGGSRKNIQQHYDLGNDFYSLFLDPTMNYSAGIFNQQTAAQNFPHSQSPMHSASLVKMDRICQKLQLHADDHVVEIGTGWGGLAIHMAKHYGCQVTTTTISQQQYDFAVQAIVSEGLEDRITVLLKDYRDLEGTFDKLVSVEMIEAVGHQFLDTYFSKCNALLKPQGTMLIQAILIGQQHYRSYRKGVDFIRAYVFPGGCLPSAVTIAQSVGRVTTMRMLDFEDMTQHYADTLMHWRNSFMQRLEEVRALGFDEYFIRLWHFYLCYCEAAFAERRCQSVQVMFAQKNSPIDVVVER